MIPEGEKKTMPLDTDATYERVPVIDGTYTLEWTFHFVPDRTTSGKVPGITIREGKTTEVPISEP